MSGAALSVRAQRRIGDFELDVAFEGAAEGVTVLFGPSGAGKSQALAIVAGAGHPTAGRIALGDAIWFDAARRIDVAPERRGVGWVFQEGRLFPHLDVRANLAYGARRARGRDAGVRFDEVVETLGVAPLLRRAPASLSGGERQRVAIGRALLSQPALLLMDEPMAALDLARRLEILPYLERLKSLYRLPILYVTHSLSEAVRLADRLVLMEGGRVRSQGPLAQVLAREDLPTASRPDAAVALDGVVLSHEAGRALTRVQVGGDVLLVPTLAAPPGAPVRAAVLARDVLLALQPPERISARNVLAGRVEAVGAPRIDAVRLVRVRLDGGATVLAALTCDAVAMLDLAPGAPVHAIVKSVAIEGLSSGGFFDAFES